MTWQPKKLTREQQEERRLAGARLLRAGKLSQSAIARELGVKRQTVNGWAKQLATGGVAALRRRRATGAPPKLTVTQQATLQTVLQRGAPAAGFPTARWTMQRVQQVIQREFGVRYHMHYMNRLLRRLGWSWQQPVPQAQERDAAAVQTWLTQDWPRIKKKRGGGA
jgi:transposase